MSKQLPLYSSTYAQRLRHWTDVTANVLIPRSQIKLIKKWVVFHISINYIIIVLYNLEEEQLFIRFFQVDPLTAELFNLNFYPLEVVSRWRDPQLQVSENYSDWQIWQNGGRVFSNLAGWCHILSLTYLKCGI